MADPGSDDRTALRWRSGPMAARVAQRLGEGSTSPTPRAFSRGQGSTVGRLHTARPSPAQPATGV